MGKRVLLIDWESAGHHQTFLGEYCLALLGLGCKVTVICPKSASMQKRLTEAGAAGALADGRLQLEEALTWPLIRFRPARLQFAIQRFSFVRSWIRMIESCELRNGSKFDLVFFCCIYEHHVPRMQKLIRQLDRPWSGLHIRTMHPEGAEKGINIFDIFRDSKLVALATLEETSANKLSTAIQRPVVVFPGKVCGSTATGACAACRATSASHWRSATPRPNHRLVIRDRSRSPPATPGWCAEGPPRIPPPPPQTAAPSQRRLLPDQCSY